MISALLLIDAKGKNIVSRYYRADVTRESADAFRTNVIAKKDTGSNPPITYIDGTTFIYVRNSDHYIVAVTKKNALSLLLLIPRPHLPLPVPPGEDVQELLRHRLQGRSRSPPLLTPRTISVTSSRWCTRSSMVTSPPPNHP
ncbi:hypothetical protein BLSTO_03493 [Blastocystis sp. subtype 1]